ncbi:MAG: hypothetical protein ACOYKA_05135 [Legionellaceae bacterium]
MNRSKHHQNIDDYEHFNYESIEELNHRKRIRKKLEDKIDRRRLMKEIQDFEDDIEDKFDWDEYYR